jgi:hypothetical protein
MSNENTSELSKDKVDGKLSKIGDGFLEAGGSNKESDFSGLSSSLAEINTQNSPQSLEKYNVQEDRRRAHRFRVNWHTDIIFEDKSTHQGIIHDISVLGASFFLDNSSIPGNSIIYIHVPPLDLKSVPDIIEVAAKTVYVVFDSNAQLYRAALNFIKFHKESDLTFLSERLNKYQREIHGTKYV